jgi:nickel-dependent lactate racemase
MTQLIKVPQLAWYEPKTLDLSFPDSWQVEVCNMAGHDRLAMTDDQIGAAITNLIGMPPIREIAKGKQEVVVIFDDLCRVTRVSKIVPAILRELAQAGVPDDNLRFVAATATHRAMNRIELAKKLGEETLARFRVYNHNPFHNCEYVGTTSYDTKVFINAEVMSCDLKIAVGSLTPHIMVLFGGGGKMILPGVASIETVMANHTIPIPDRKDYDNHPRRLDMEEAAALAGLDVNIECLVNQWGDTTAIYAGARIQAHAAGVSEARLHYATPKAEEKDIVIANTYAKASEAITGAFLAMPSVTQKGGDFVLICNAPEGQVVHYGSGVWGKALGGLMGTLPQVEIPPHIKHFIVYTEYPDFSGLGYFKKSDKLLVMDNWKDVIKFLQGFHGSDTEVAVYPNSDIQYFA